MMSEDAGSSGFATELEVHSVDHFCSYCKRLLKGTVRVIAKLKGAVESYANLCPGCLGVHYQEIDIESYKICGKMSQVVAELDGQSAETALSCINLVERQGIEQMEVVKEQSEEENRTKAQYLQLDERVFQRENLAFRVKEPRYEVDKCSPQEKENNPANRKHLRALGYNWQRKEFDYQPETIFGLLLGTLERDEEQDQEEYDQLASVLYRQYKKEQEQLNSTKDYLVNTMFLLGRKGFQKTEGIPEAIIQIRKKEEEAKKLIPKIYNLINELEESCTSTEREERKRNKKSKKEKRKKSKSHSRQGMEKGSPQHSRTREKKKKQHREASPSESIEKAKWKQAKRMQKQARKEKPNASQSQQSREGKAKEEPTPAPLPQEDTQESKAAQSKEGESKEASIQKPKEQPIVKRGRGRPKGSVQKAKILGGKFLAASQLPQGQDSVIVPTQEKKKPTDDKPKNEISHQQHGDKPERGKPSPPNQGLAEQKSGFEVQFDSD